MKKILLIPFLLSFQFAYAGTGSANDEIPLILLIIAAGILILAVIYLFEYIRKMRKKRREQKTAQDAGIVQNEDTDQGPFTQMP
jgi:hypothetical protein